MVRRWLLPWQTRRARGLSTAERTSRRLFEEYKEFNMLSPARFTRWLNSDRLNEMAERVAGRSRLAVWQRVADRLGDLEASEARGYVRVRALSIVEAETSRLVEQEGPRVGRIRQRLVATATQALVETIVAQVQSRRSTLLQRQAA